MKIERFEDIEAWQMARELTQKARNCKGLCAKETDTTCCRRGFINYLKAQSSQP